VLGGAGHELQWSHRPGSREADVRTLYTSTDDATARRLIARYGIGYVVAGPIERTDYGEQGLAKWDRLGRRVLDMRGTTVWALRGAGRGRGSGATPATPASPPSDSRGLGR
jgi:uncharacterized membrane protein